MTSSNTLNMCINLVAKHAQHSPNTSFFKYFKIAFVVYFYNYLCVIFSMLSTLCDKMMIHSTQKNDCIGTNANDETQSNLSSNNFLPFQKIDGFISQFL